MCKARLVPRGPQSGATAVRGDPGARSRGSWWCITATIAAVVLVHGRNLGADLVLDDYGWLERRPSSVVAVVDTFRPPSGAGIYRPLLKLWFGAMSALFGSTNPLPYHVFAVLIAVVAALAVRWMCLELGITMPAATAAGIFMGTHGSLVITTRWVSAMPSMAMAACAATAIALVQRPGRRRHVVAAAFLVVAILWRDSAVVVPALTVILLVARPGYRVRDALSATVELWVVALTYGILRLADGALGGGSDAYRSELGWHMLDNLATILRDTARLGITRRAGTGEAVVFAGLLVLFWGVVVGGSLWAATRRRYLPLAGLLGYLVGLAPFVGLVHHAMETYYIEVGILGLAVTIGALVDAASLRTTVLIGMTAAFVVVQMVAADLVVERHWIHAVAARTSILVDYAHEAEISRRTLIVEEACADDRAITVDGALFRVVLDRPDLRVRFHVLAPGAAPTTRWGCGRLP
jgi:hypothetical protein